MRAFIQIIGLGLLNGSRTFAVPAILSRRLVDHQPEDRRGLVWVLGSPRTAKVLRWLATGELVGDKLPMTRARTETWGLIGRGTMGALMGWTLGGMHRQSRLFGAGLGALAAIIGAYVGYHWRKNTVTEHELPDPAVALWEDTLVLVGGRALARFTPNGHRQVVEHDTGEAGLES